MGIGTLTVIFIACKFPTWFGAMLEAGGRNQFPFDYLPALSRIIDFFEKNGFTKGDLINPGSDKPGINMLKGENEIGIYLDSPLDEELPSEIEIVFCKTCTFIETINTASCLNKFLFTCIEWMTF